MRITVVVVVVSSLLSACRNIKRKQKRALPNKWHAPKRLIVPEFRIHVDIRKQKKRKVQRHRFCFAYYARNRLNDHRVSRGILHHELCQTCFSVGVGFRSKVVVWVSSRILLPVNILFFSSSRWPFHAIICGRCVIAVVAAGSRIVSSCCRSAE